MSQRVKSSSDSVKKGMGPIVERVLVQNLIDVLYAIARGRGRFMIYIYIFQGHRRELGSHERGDRLVEKR